ncbi:MAG: patatin-like phospholipase family protein [Thermoflexales bacterium]|nr:patatin-like phospholipase family protein [Thermoflexales bacterium]MDW8350468.1 patatin-like phospholipase family protein [Anaerolineae bacterium]
MRAFVLSGGGNRGPLQAGAIKTLLRRGITPDIIVGSSVGALHGAYLAAEPTLAQAERMIELWRDASRRKLFGNSPLQSVLGALRGSDHLADNRRLRAYIAQTLPKHVRTFGDLQIPLYVTICHLQTLTLYLYGDDPSAPLIDAVLTSAAVPGFFPPTYHEGQAFVDGGVISNLPVLVALARGATEIWALDLAFEVEAAASPRSVFEIAGHALRRPLYSLALRELEIATQHAGVVVHHIALPAYANLQLGDFSKTDAMLAEGERLACEYLDRPRPNEVRYPHRYTAHELPPGPPGARPFLQDIHTPIAHPKP